MATVKDLSDRIRNLLLERHAQTIDFTFDKIHVDATTLGGAAMKVWMTSSIFGLDVKVAKGAKAGYDIARDALVFPDANYGTSADERAWIIRECVRAMRASATSVAGTKASLPPSEEAASYVAASMHAYNFQRSAGPRPVSPKWVDEDGVWAWAYVIAQLTVENKNPVVPADQASTLLKRMKDFPNYGQAPR